MADHGSSENGINLADAHIEYREFSIVVTEAVAGFSQLYNFVVSKVSSSRA